MWLVVGLGNPGRRYSRTRHNVGFLFIRSLARTLKVRVKKRKYGSKMQSVEYRGENLLLAMPQTYMNLSGHAVHQILMETSITPNRLIVVYDDLEIPLGDIRVRKEGRAGSHRGMQSTIQEIGTSRFPRIRIGIGPLPEREDASEFVLSPFLEKEIPILDEALTKARQAVNIILDGQIEKAMNIFNVRVKSM